MNRNPGTRKLTDRERILAFLAMVTGPFFKVTSEPTPQELPCWAIQIRPGDLVRCNSQMAPSRWNVAWYVGPSPDPKMPDGTHLLRELGSEEVCHMRNESLWSLRGHEDSPYLLEGRQWKAYVAVEKAFRQVAKVDRWIRFYTLRFPDRHATAGEIIVRPHAFLGPKQPGKSTLALAVPFTFDRRTSGRQVREAVLAAVAGVKWEDRDVDRTDPTHWIAKPAPAWEEKP